MMKKIISLVLMLMMMVSSVSVMALDYGEEWNNYEDNNGRVYKDVPATHWAYNAINRVSGTQWFSGYPDGTFRPDAQITREEAMKVIVTFLGLELKETVNSSYYDVEASRWSSAYIEAGKLLFPKIETYNGQNPFQPDMPIKREDIMYAMVIAKKYNNEVKFVDQSVLNMFDDANSISANVKPYVALAVNIGLVAGKGTSIGAQDPLTRAEFATLLYRATYIGDGTGNGLSDIAEVLSVELNTPVFSELNIGDVLEVKATAKMSNGEETDYSTNLNPYNSSNNNVVLMNKNVITAVNAGTAVIEFNGDDMLAGKSIVVNVKAPAQNSDNGDEDEDERNNPGNDDDERDNPGSDDDERDNPGNDDDEDEDLVTLTGIEWSVDALELNEGDASQIKLIGTYSDGSTKDVTRDFNLYSTDEEVAEVASNGKVTAVGEGEAKINFKSKTATVQSHTIPRPIEIVVKAASRNEIVALEWSTETVTVSVDETKTIKLYAVYGDGSKEDITEDCGVYSLDEDIAVVDGNQLKGISEGKTELWFESVPNVGIDLPELLKVTVD